MFTVDLSVEKTKMTSDEVIIAKKYCILVKHPEGKSTANA